VHKTVSSWRVVFPGFREMSSKVIGAYEAVGP
jgi:hypothetical protein